MDCHLCLCGWLMCFLVFDLSLCNTAIDSDMLLKLLPRRCVVLGIPPLSNNASNVMSILSTTFSKEADVFFGVLDLSSRVRKLERIFAIEADGSIREGDVVLAYQPKPDRQCLLSRPKAPKMRIVLDAMTKGSINIEDIVNTVNKCCTTYRAVNGSLNRLGIRRKAALEGLFHVATYENFTIDTKAPAAYSLLDGAALSQGDSVGFAGLVSGTKGAEQTCQQAHIPVCQKVPVPSKNTFVRDYLLRSKPVIFAGGAAHWIAFKKWTHEYLLQMYGSRTVHVKLTPDGEYEGVERASLWHKHANFQIPAEVLSKLPFPELVVVRPAPVEMKFSDFLATIRHSPESLVWAANASAYLEYSSLSQFPELEEHVEEMDFVKGILVRSQANVWLSDGNTLGKLHFDPYDNLLCQISGRKELLLYEPHNNSQLYEAHIPEAQLGFDARTGMFSRRQLMDSTSMVMSPVDPKRPDLEAFPEFAHARPMKCTIEEGDVLYLPAFWWHEVQSFPGDPPASRNLAVNFWYEPFYTKEFPCPECRMDVNSLYYDLLESDIAI